ncbi:MAG: hypothetical protein HOI23_16560 [Deltaproteobacteria bacterium]|jgi:hypothetical protein|nr:hypothetical protein [Deltaproteobacteria bacterium]MBT6432949.1 hypothetical protein [Deltaproteobacteria bacterium]
MRNLSGALMIVLLAGCGSNGTSENIEPCTVKDGEGPFTTVDLLINTPLPEVFTESCGAANLEELEVFLTIPGEESCFLTVNDGLINGCCVGVETNQNVYAALIYRVPPGFSLGEQAKLIELPTTAESVVNLSFEGSDFDGSIYDGDNDGEHNIDEYCAGTLN